jgi:uncharacterized protein (TIGR02271 family)
MAPVGDTEGEGRPRRGHGATRPGERHRRLAPGCAVRAGARVTRGPQGWQGGVIRAEAEERELWRHYGLDYDAARRGRQTGHDAAGDDRTDRDTDDAMTRSEEELQVGTTARERGPVRLRKYVTTEQEQVTVPVRREEVRVQREPVTDANVAAATRGPDISEAEHEVVLREEEPVVEKRAVPKERVRLDTDTVTDEQQVGEEVRKERIEVEDENRLRRDRRPS